MKESPLYDARLVASILHQIGAAIDDILLWNKDVSSAEDYYASAEGMKTLAATSMLLEAIGESVKRIENMTQGTLFVLRPEIPWTEIMGMRNHIAHGYFDIDTELIFDTIKNDLEPLKTAIDFLEAQFQ